MAINTYYRLITGHVNIMRKIYQSFILALSHFPSLFVAVFLRKNMGERFYTLSASLTFAVILLVPFVVLTSLSNYYNPKFLKMFDWPWAIFVCIFITYSIVRRLEFKRNTHIVRTDQFSYYEGDMLWPLWLWIEKKVPFLKAHPLYIRKYYEPALVFISAFVLGTIFVGSFVFFFLLITSILQFLRVQVQYAEGRNFIMDKIDEIIANEELFESLVNDKPAEETRGFSFFAPKPESREVREKMVDLIIEKDDKNRIRVQ